MPRIDQKFIQELPVDGSTFGTFLDVNVTGLRTLYAKEVRRFMKVGGQSLVAPLVTTLLFLAIFALALGGSARHIGDVPYLQFLAPGLIMMSVVQNAFANTSSSLVIAKVQGNIVDYLMPPLSPAELMVGMVAAGMTRGIMVGVLVALAMLPFVQLTVHHWGSLVFSILAATAMLSLLGMLGGLWAEKFDQMAAVTNYVITPLSFLSGTFYSIRDLPEPFHLLALANPFFYMIDGLRFALTGHADGDLLVGAVLLLVTILALGWATYRALRSGWRLKV